MSAPVSTSAGKLSASQRRQVVLITLVALALYLGFRFLPTGTNLSHTDFRAGAGGLEMCDPANPQFVPVVAMKSPVTMTLTPDATPESGASVHCLLALQTASGKPVGPVDLQLSHTRKLHLLIVDETLQDYQHVHPEPTEEPGVWSFHFTPRASGVYRVFGDFTPTATGRALYASADLKVVPGKAIAPVKVADVAERAAYAFAVVPAQLPVRAGQAVELSFTIERSDGGAVKLEPVMGAWAHLVAFDLARSGFAHLHPKEVDLAVAPDAKRPRLTFKITIPEPGRYIVWAQVNIDGRERFEPFALHVVR